ncbi:MAG: 2-oxo acid dehydrogenase subunit E2 [Chloroflexi bacterium]|nr:2-oxo acid dehydrogenase subunit E2 [Chloroflexota bacterium]
MAKDVIMPALGMAQETGTLLKWFKAPGETVTKGEPLMEVETDKASVEVEAAASGILAQVTARPGDVIPVGQAIAVILNPGETATAPKTDSIAHSLTASPVAARMAAEHNLDLTQIKPQGGRVRKEDVLAYLAARQDLSGTLRENLTGLKPNGRVLASPKARRLAQERGLDLADISGSGPEGAVLANDVETFRRNVSTEAETLTVSRTWRVMVERLTQAWTTIPHFYLLREVNAAQLMSWRDSAQSRATEKITYTDLLVKLTAAALRRHPRVNASWKDGGLTLNPEVNIGLAVAVDDGLIVPVIHHADQLGLSQLAARRKEAVTKAQAGKLSLDDLSGGTFTISNLGMYGVDAFNAIINPPQAAILAVSRIADRVVPLNGQPAVQPMLTLSLSCDHRAVDGARGAQFLQTLAELVEEPMKLLD